MPMSSWCHILSCTTRILSRHAWYPLASPAHLLSLPWCARDLLVSLANTLSLPSCISDRSTKGSTPWHPCYLGLGKKYCWAIWLSLCTKNYEVGFRMWHLTDLRHNLHVMLGFKQDMNSGLSMKVATLHVTPTSAPLGTTWGAMTKCQYLTCWHWEWAGLACQN